MIPLTPRFNREIRLGLVVYGGVSLAIYMNGVCREFYNAVRGRGVYKLIKALTDSDIVVDIISGTSAGGINGVLLAYALANSTQEEAWDFKDFAGIWRESGNIGLLLRTPDERQNIDSFLNGEGFYQDKLTEAFDAFITPREKRGPRDVAIPTETKDSEEWFTPKDDVVANPMEDWFSPFDELDLFVTGTDLLGRVTRQFDNTGKVIEVKQHEAMFLLKHRKGRDEKTGHYQPFKPSLDNNKFPQRALAKLCRITSCFPVAFPVVSVALDNKGQQDWEVDERLIRWGKLADRILPDTKIDKPRELHFVDGGVLDNRPFGYTIGEIYRRQFTRPVTRHLLFIDPSPDTFIGSESFKAMARPDVWKTAVDSLVSLPRYESIAEDLKQIIIQNVYVRRYRFLRETTIRGVLQNIESVGKQTDPSHDDGDKEVYLSVRLVSMRDRLLQQLVGETPEDNLNKKRLMTIAAKKLTALITDPMVAKTRAEMLIKMSNEIQCIDVSYFIRKQLFLITQVVEVMKDSRLDPHSYSTLKGLAAGLNRQLSLLEVIQSALDYQFSRLNIQHKFLRLVSEGDDPIAAREAMYQFLIYLHQRLIDGATSDYLGWFLHEKYHEATQDPRQMQFNAEDWISAVDVDTFYAALKQRADDIARDIDISYDENAKYFQKNDKKDRRTLLQMSDACSLRLITSLATRASHNEEPSEQPKNHINNFIQLLKSFDQIDQKLFPYEYLSGFHTEDLTKITRISPEDAKRGFGKHRSGGDEPKPIEERLAGIQLRAFGGFLKKSWRSNDMLWGRLDGLNRLVDILLTPESLSHFPIYLRRHKGKDDHEIEINRALSELLTAAFPPTGTSANSPQDSEQQALDQNLEKLQTALSRLAHCKDQKAVKTLLENEPTLLEEIKNRIVEAGQMAILQTDLKQVLQDTLSEQTEWNVQMVKPNSRGNTTPPMPKFEPIQGYLEPSFSVFATQALIKPEIRSIFETPQKLKNYFTKEYRVGSERFVTHVPPLIREKLLAQLLLLFRNMLDSPPTGATLNKSAAYQLFGNLLQTYRFLVNTKDPSKTALPPLLRRLVPWLGVALLVGALAYVVSQIPAPLLVASITLLLLQFLYSLVASRSLVSQGLRALSLLVLAALLLSVSLGLPWPEPGGGLRLRNIVQGRSCPPISTPWAPEKCAAR